MHTCVCLCVCVFITYENVFLSSKMLFCHWFYRHDCKENTRVTEPVLSCSIEYLTTNRNTIQFLKFQKSLEYSCAYSIKLHTRWSDSEMKSTLLAIIGRVFAGWNMCLLTTVLLSPVRRWIKTNHAISRCLFLDTWHLIFSIIKIMLCFYDDYVVGFKLWIIIHVIYDLYWDIHRVRCKVGTKMFRRKINNARE